MADLRKRLRERKASWIGAGMDPDELCQEADDRIEALEARVAAADKLADAGSVMARALEGDYIVPGSAAKWNTALAAYEATKEPTND